MTLKRNDEQIKINKSGTRPFRSNVYFERMFLSAFLFFLNEREDEPGERGDISGPSWEDSGWTRRPAAFVFFLSPSNPSEQEHRALLMQRLNIVLKRSRFPLT